MVLIFCILSIMLHIYTKFVNVILTAWFQSYGADTICNGQTDIGKIIFPPLMWGGGDIIMQVTLKLTI